ncbi:enoyl-CoA delta isomerase 1, peroxisomal isoform X2 [Nematostella vectensis]|uniref:enoyl-CoA delta isomerase 1, peroxisomal isoform X2 n=1 Tax=Nematostella vectensis TaxID=45351 RepID=UPI00138FB621|nr:enoyl-CoA delta isomerase 1, peroxisomal isoform X2 [Nematostella vectensis]
MEDDMRSRIFAEFVEDYAILRMNNGENRFTIESVNRLNEVLDEIISNQRVKFLITVGSGKYFSNGFVIERLLSESVEDNKVVPEHHRLLMKLLTFPLPTIAAINGHAYAGGALLALAHDYRIMQTSRGWFCLPEIRLRAKMPSPRVALDSIIMGKKFTAEQAFEVGLVEGMCTPDKLLSTAIQYGRNMVEGENYDRDHMQQMKANLYEHVIKAVNETIGSFTAKL